MINIYMQFIEFTNLMWGNNKVINMDNKKVHLDILCK